MPHYSEFYTVSFWFVIELLQLVRAGGSARVAKVLAFASFGLQILESVNYVDMSCNVFTS